MIIDLALRTGVVFAVIVATKRYDIWDSSDETKELYDSTVKWMKPYAQRTCDYLNIYVPALPPQKEKSFLGVYIYNQTVIKLVDALNIFPTYVYDVLNNIPGAVTEFGKHAREHYDKYQKEYERQKLLRKEITERKFQLDESLIVLPVPDPSNDPDPKCEKATEPKDAIPNREGPCHRPSATPRAPPSTQPELKEPCIPEKKCNCPQCKMRRSQGW